MFKEMRTLAWQMIEDFALESFTIVRPSDGSYDPVTGVYTESAVSVVVPLVFDRIRQEGSPIGSLHTISVAYASGIHLDLFVPKTGDVIMQGIEKRATVGAVEIDQYGACVVMECL